MIQESHLDDKIFHKFFMWIVFYPLIGDNVGRNDLFFIGSPYNLIK